MTEMDYKAIWQKAVAIGKRRAEAMYPADQPERRRRRAHLETMREYRSMTSSKPYPL